MPGVAVADELDGITGWTTVDELTDRHPVTKAVLHSYGLPAAHAGRLTLAAIAERDGLDLSELLSELHAAARRSTLLHAGGASAPDALR